MSQAVASHSNESVADNRDFYHLVQQSFSIRRHIEIFLWLNGDLQRFLPHDVLVVAWGDFNSAALQFDVISAMPQVRTHFFRGGELVPLARNFHAGWVARGSLPFTVERPEGFFESSIESRPPLRALGGMRAAVVHGLQDVRTNTTYLYFCLSTSAWLRPDRVRAAIEFVLPHLDVALRRLTPVLSEMSTSIPLNRLSDAIRPPVASATPDLGLSRRESEVMSWVRMGKTNQEIGQILSISTFTVKNHLQRIFKKLDVLNRAQAVASMSDDRSQSRAA